MNPVAALCTGASCQKVNWPAGTSYSPKKSHWRRWSAKRSRWRIHPAAQALFRFRPRLRGGRTTDPAVDYPKTNSRAASNSMSEATTATAAKKYEQSTRTAKSAPPGVEDGKSAVRPLRRRGMAMACRYQAGPQLSSRAGWGKRRPSIRRRARRNDRSSTRDCIIPVAICLTAFYIG
jgi:hypothetical protein